MSGGPYRSRGVLRGLADIRFTQMVTPRLIGWLYVAAAGVVTLGALGGLLLIWSVASFMGAGWWWFAPLVLACGVAGLLVVRVACEWVLMAFTRGRAVEQLPPPPRHAPPMGTSGAPMPQSPPGARDAVRRPVSRESWPPNTRG